MGSPLAYLMMLGCCLALYPAVCAAPSAFDQLLGPIEAAVARIMVPALPDPADPPPRLLS